MTDLVRALDVSVYSGRTSRQWWRDRRAEGWELAVCGSWHGNSTNPFVQDQLGWAYEAGMMLATYVALSRWHGGDEQVAEARHACGDFWPLLRFVALDMELPGLEAWHLDAALVELEWSKYFAPEATCYTGYWWWEPWVKNHFSEIAKCWPNLSAWVAYYDGRAALNLLTTGPPGTRPLPKLTGLGPIIGKQYAATHIDGVAVDLNVFDAEWLKEDEQMGQTPEQWGGGWARIERDFAPIEAARAAWKAAWPHSDEEKADDIRECGEKDAVEDLAEAIEEFKRRQLEPRQEWAEE